MAHVKHECSPNRFSFNLQIRRTMVLLVFAGSLCAIVGILAHWDDLSVRAVLSDGKRMLILAGAFIVYTLYLFASIEHGVLDPPVTRFRLVPSVLLPSATFLAYLCMPLEALFLGGTKALSYTAFPLMYLSWTSYNLVRLWQIRNQPGSGRAKVAVWFVIDGICAVALIHNLKHYAQFGEDFYSWNGVGPKDFAISFSSLLYIGWKWTTRQAWYDPYHEDMRDFVKRLKADPSAELAGTPGKSLLAGLWPGIRRIPALDFGSGGSERSISLLKWLGAPVECIHLTRYDVDDRCDEACESVSELAGSSFTSDFDIAKATAAKAAIVVVSHALYTTRCVRDLCRLLDGNQQELFLLVRGGSAESFLAPLVIYRLFSWMRPFYSACWDTDTIPYLMKRLGLRSIGADRKTHTDPHPFLIAQTVNIDRDAMHHLLGPLRHHYGERFRQTFEELLSRHLRLAKLRGETSVSVRHSDVVYVLHRPARPKPAPPLPSEAPTPV